MCVAAHVCVHMFVCRYTHVHECRGMCVGTYVCVCLDAHVCAPIPTETRGQPQYYPQKYHPPPLRQALSLVWRHTFTVGLCPSVSSCLLPRNLGSCVALHFWISLPSSIPGPDLEHPKWTTSVHWLPCVFFGYNKDKRDREGNSGKANGVMWRQCPIH